MDLKGRTQNLATNVTLSENIGRLYDWSPHIGYIIRIIWQKVTSPLLWLKQLFWLINNTKVRFMFIKTKAVDSGTYALSDMLRLSLEWVPKLHWLGHHLVLSTASNPKQLVFRLHLYQENHPLKFLCNNNNNEILHKPRCTKKSRNFSVNMENMFPGWF